MLFKFQKIVGCIEPWVKNRDTNRIVSLCIVTALVKRQRAYKIEQGPVTKNSFQERSEVTT